MNTPFLVVVARDGLRDMEEKYNRCVCKTRMMSSKSNSYWLSYLFLQYHVYLSTIFCMIMTFFVDKITATE